jgi:ABC-type glycerol-3-phosphate transport system permease component
VRWVGAVFRHGVLLLAAAGVVFPLYFIVAAALKSDSEYASDRIGLPNDPTLGNIGDVLTDPNVLRWFTNSVIITVASAGIAIVCGVLAAYAIARAGGAAASSVLTGLIALMAVPPVVLVIPLFVMMADLGMLNSLIGVILIYSGLLVPLSVYLLVGFFRGIPRELDEAAFIDGAGRAAVLRHVLLPLARPALLTLAVVNAVYVWNEFLIALLFLQREESQTLMVGITTFQGRFQADEPLLMAWSLFASVPILLLYVFGQRFLVRGLVSGAFK